MNYNYKGSISERKVKFSSSVEVIANEQNELFNAISVYVPSTLAAANIVDYDPAWVTAEQPAVFMCVLDNYREIMQGNLFKQWGDVFCSDTNASVIVYVIVFLADDTTSAMWSIEDVSIKFAPITKAFESLYWLSYVKVLFDETYDGRPSILPPLPGTTASAQLRLVNDTDEDIEVEAGNYSFNDGAKDWLLSVLEDVTLAPTENIGVTAKAIEIGDGALLEPGQMDTDIIPEALEDLTINVLSVTQGTNAATQPTEVPSKFFDYSLALALLCKQDIKLSYFISMVKTSFVDREPNPDDVCWARKATKAEEEETMLSLKGTDRGKYYWGALVLMGCVTNTWVLIHSEFTNTIPLIFAAWFTAGRNSSGQFVANKLSLLRLKGSKVKPFGFPSWINDEVNENDAVGLDLLDSKNIGYLVTISDNTPQESCVSSARSIDGTPVAAQMISKWVDYTSSQQVADFLTSVDTAGNPVLTNEESYNRIQNIVFGNLTRFVPIGRISNILLQFPPFAVAKKGLRALVAMGAWTASYTDDLDEVTVSGGLTAE